MSSGLSFITSLMRLASRIICLIVIAWFVVFAVDQTGAASARQQNEVAEGSAPTPTVSHESTTSAPHESTLHRALDETSNTLTSPFAGVVSGSQSEWTIHIVKTALALLVYGFGLAFLARFLRVKV